ELRVQNEALAEAEALAVAERDRYRDLFEFAPSPYLVTDAEGTVRELNRAAAELLQISPRYAVGKPLAVFVRKEDRPAFHKQLTALQKGEPAWEQALWLQPRAVGGKPRAVELTVVPFRDLATREPRLRWQARDVTDRHQAAEDRRELVERLESEVRERTAELQRLLREK